MGLLPSYLPSELTLMPEAEETIGTQLAKLDGKIDLLSQKLDAHKDLLVAKMEAGDRESGQAIALTNERVTNLAGQVNENKVRLTAVELVASKPDPDLATRVEALEDAIEPVPTLRNLVYGFVALVLTAVVLGLLALVLKGTP